MKETKERQNKTKKERTKETVREDKMEQRG
jgi:hypothetical protein